MGDDTCRFSCAAVLSNNTPADQAAHLHQQQQPGGARRQAGQGQAAVRLHANLHVPAGAYRCSPAPGARSQRKGVAVHTRWSTSRRTQQDSSGTHVIACTLLVTNHPMPGSSSPFQCLRPHLSLCTLLCKRWSRLCDAARCLGSEHTSSGALTRHAHTPFIGVASALGQECVSTTELARLA